MTEENSSMDYLLGCLNCLWNKRTSDSFNKTSSQGCTDCLQSLHPIANPCVSCHRNFKCRPWRRKSILNSAATNWSWINLLPWTTLFLLLTNIVQGGGVPLKKCLRLNPVWGLFFVTLFGGISLPMASCQANLQPTQSFKSQQLPNAVIHVGSAFTYNISDSAFDCEVDSIVVSETADRFLSHWLAYSSSKKQLYGVPTDKDEGLYNILVVALTKDARDSGHICGSRSFFIKVVPVSEEFPVSIYPGAGTSSKESTSAQSLPCVPGTQVVQATVVLNADIHGLNGHERMALVLKIADHLNLHTRTVSLFPGQASHPIIGQLDNPTVMVAGAGDGRFAKGSKSLLTWLAGCGAIKLEDLALSKLETDSQDGTISSLLGVPVVGWHVMSGAQKKLARHRIRRQVIGVTATPTTQSVPPSRMSNISTSVIVSRTVTVTSAFSRSSVIQLSTSVLSSVAANRTYVSSLSIPTIITRILSQPLSRTDVLSSSINNITSSNIRISPSSMRFTETVIVNSSEIVFSRNVTTSIKSSALFSSLKRTTLLMSSSVFSSTVNSTFITRTATSSVSSSAMSSLSLTTSRARNSSSIAVPPNETAATVSSLLTVTSVNSTRLTPSSVFTTNFSSQTLVPFASQVNSSAVPGTSLLAVSSSTPTPVVSHSSVAVSPYETTATVSSLLTVPSVNSTRLIPSSVFATNFSSQTMVPFASQVNSSAVAGTSLLAVSSSTPTPIVSHSSFLSSASLNLTITLQPTSGPKSSTSLLNVATSTPLLRTLTMSTKLSPILSTSSSFALEANSSVLITSSVNQTVASTRSHASNSSTIVSSFVAMSSFSSLETPPNTTTVIVGNASSSLFVSTHLRSSPVMSTPQQNSTTVQNRTSATLMLTPSLSLVPTVRSIISSFDTTVQTVSSAVTNSSSLVTPSFSGSVAMLSSSVLLPTSSVFSSSSIVKVNVSTVVTNFTSPSLQPNVTSTAVVLSSFTASPVVTSLNFTSMLISVNASTTRRTPLLNSTSKFDRSSFATITSSEFSPTGTIGSRTFPTTFADNRTVIPSSSTGVDIATVNVTVTRIISTNSASLSTLVVTSFLLSSTFKLDLTSTKTSSSLPGSSIVDVNSSVISRTLSSAVTRLVNSSVSSPRTSLPFFTTVSATQAAEVNSTTFIPTSSQMLPNSSLLSLVISSSSKPVFASSTILLPDTSSVLKATETSVSFTLVGSSVLNTSATVLSMFVSSPKIVSTEIRTAIGSSLARNSSAFDASLVTSPLTSRTLTIASRSNTILLSESLQNTTTVLRTSGLVSPSMTASVLSSSSVILSSGFGTNSTTTRIPSSATVTPTFTTGLPISVTVTPSSLGVQTTPAVRSFTQGTSVKSFITPVFTRSTLQTDVATPGSTRTVALTTQVLFSSSAVISVSSRTPSLVPPSATFTPVNRTTASGVATSGLSTVTSRTATRETLSSTFVKMSSFVASTVGSRISTLRSSPSQTRSTNVTSSSPSSFTPLVTKTDSTVVITASSVQRLVSLEVTQINSSAFTSFSIALTMPSIATQSKRSPLTQSSAVVTRSTSLKIPSSMRSVTPDSSDRETSLRFTLRSSRVESTQIRSPLIKANVTSTVISSDTISVTSMIPSMTFSFQTSATPFISKPLSVTSAVFTPGTKSQTSSLSVTSRVITNVTFTKISTKTISVTSLIPSVSSTFQTSVTAFLSKPLSFTPAVLSSSPKSQMSSQSVTFAVTSRVTTSVSSFVSTSVTSGVFKSMTSSLNVTSRMITSVTSTEISTKTISLTSLIPSVSSTFQTSVTPILSKPLSFTSTVLASSPKSQMPSQRVTFAVTSRVTTSVLSFVSPNVTSGALKSVTMSRLSRSFSVAEETKTSPMRSVGSSVTQSSDELSFKTALLSQTPVGTTMVTRVQRSTSLLSSRQLTGSTIVSVVKTTRTDHSVRSSQVTRTSVSLQSSRSTLTTRGSPVSSKKTLTLSSSVLDFASSMSSLSSAKSIVVSRISTRFLSAVSISTRMLSSSSIDLPSSNTTQIVTPTDSAVTLSVTPSSTVIIPTTAPSNSPPRLYNNMGRISAPAGKALYFTIPDDTFYDSEDKATTRNLALSVLLADGSSIPSDFWLQFDATSQTIYGLPLSEHVPSGVIGEGFILRAQDSQGAQALDAFEVLVVPSEEPVVQELRIRIANDFSVFNRNVSQRLLLLEKIATYYGDRDTSSIRVLTFFAGSVIMTWTNDSLPTDRCDDEKVDYVANKVLLPDGEVSLDFKVALQGFPVESASENRQGVCNGSEPVPGTPIGPAQQSRLEEDMWYKHVLVGVLIALIILVLAALLIWYCRRKRPKPSNEKRTYKKRKPIILEPDIELKPIPGKPLVLPDDDPSIPPSYISETSLDKPLSSDDEDEWDYGRRSPSVVYEPPPPFYPTLANDHRNSPPPVYLMPPMY